MIQYYVRRQDGKTYGQFSTRHSALSATVEYHDANRFEVFGTGEKVPEAVPDPRYNGEL